MKRLYVLRGLRRRVGVTAALAAMLMTIQPCVTIARSTEPMKPRTTRLQPARAERQEPVASEGSRAAEREAALKQLYLNVREGAPIAREEAQLLSWLEAGVALTDLELDVLVSRALYDFHVANRPLTARQQELLDRYREFLVRNQEETFARDVRPPSARKGDGLAPLAPPSNDLCSGAVSIPGSGPFPALSPVVNVAEATETGDPAASCAAGNRFKSVWFTFTPSQSANYLIQTCNPSTLTSVAHSGGVLGDTVLSVFTSNDGTCNGTFAEFGGCNDDGCPLVNGPNSGGGSTQILALTAGTTYYILVWKFGPQAVLEPRNGVQLMVTTATPPNDTCAGSLPLSLNVPVPGTTSNGINDYQLAAGDACLTGIGQNATTAPGVDLVYSFTAPAAGQYSFRVNTYRTTDGATQSANPAIYLSSSCPAATVGVPVEVPCLAAANRSALGEHISGVSLASGQTVYLYVDSSGMGSVMNFIAEVYSTTLEVEPNDTPATASAPSSYNGVEGSVGSVGDVDFYSLGSPAAGSRVFAMVDGLGSNDDAFQLRVTSATGTIESDAGNNDVKFGSSSSNVAGTTAPGGPLYLRVSHSSAASAPYRIYAVVQPASTSAAEEIEPNGTIELADSEAGNYFAGEITPSSDVDVYAFEATVGDLIYLALDQDPTLVPGNVGSTSPFNGKIDLLNNVGAYLIGVDDSGGSSSAVSGAGDLAAAVPNKPAESLVFTARYTGIYYARVASSSTGTGDYLLSIARGGEVGPLPCTITCPANVTVSNDEGRCGAVVTYAAPTTTGDCGTVTCTPASGSTFPVGTTTVTCSTASGPSCSFTVTVEDDENPTVSCPSNIVRSTDSGQCNAVVTYTSPFANDNCPGAMVSCSPASGSTFTIGTTTVTCTATDAAGNTASCGFTVTVNDTQAPTIACPSPITVMTQSDTGAVVNFTTPTGSDACSLPVSVICSPASGTTFPVGMTTVTCTATDNVGNTAMCTFPVNVQLPSDTIGTWSDATWFLRNSNTSGNADVTFIYGTSNLVPIDGDWDGDGDDTAGGYDPMTGTFFLRNTNSTGAADITFLFGLGGQGYVPLSGDWDGDGDDTIGLYNPATGVFFLRNENASGDADLAFQFGLGGQGYQPVTGDWDGDGDDTVGLYNPATGFFFIKNENTPGDADQTFQFGLGGQGYRALSGDWDGDGDDTVGLYAPSSATFFLIFTNGGGNADLAFIYGAPNATPLTGNWDGN